MPNLSPPTADHFPAAHPPVNHGKIGVLLVNLGTPESCTPAAVRRYLAEFLSDRRVIELSPWLWQPILHGIILRTRPAKVAKAYAHIWLHEPDESPLRRYTRHQAEQLQLRFAATAPWVQVAWAMRYGVPAQSQQLLQLQQQGCERILVAPLYPQYSATTTGTVVDQVFKTLATVRWQPSIRLLPPYYDHPAYINALADSIRHYLASVTQPPQVILVSFHGLPQANLAAGDPYYCQCVKTTRLLTAQLALDNLPLTLVFQSRFGPKAWLQPYADQTIVALAQQGIQRLVVITPGFAADCLETLEEIGMQNRDLFLKHGGQQYAVIPCLNASVAGIDLLSTLIGNELAGWSNSLIT